MNRTPNWRWIIAVMFLFAISLAYFCGGGGNGGGGGGGGSSPPTPSPSAGTISLAWDTPTANVDGSPLTDLAGYKIYYGTASLTYDHSVDVRNVTTYILTGLAQGQTYYIAAIAYDTFYNESDVSNEVSGVAR